MSDLASHDVTELLYSWSNGNRQAFNDLAPLVYSELRRLAESYFRNERIGHVLQPTALIHEAYLRLISQSRPEWRSRAHFYGVAAQIMRQVLVDYARNTRAAKRGGGAQPVPLDAVVTYAPERSSGILELDDALKLLATVDERKCRAIELRYFGGLTVDETAEALGISPATVGRELRMAEAWLHRELDRTGK